MPQKKSSKNEEMKFDEALELFSEGTKLVEICSEKIKNAKQKIQIVTEVEDDDE